MTKFNSKTNIFLCVNSTFSVYMSDVANAQFGINLPTVSTSVITRPQSYFRARGESLFLWLLYDFFFFNFRQIVLKMFVSESLLRVSLRKLLSNSSL